MTTTNDAPAALRAMVDAEVERRTKRLDRYGQLVDIRDLRRESETAVALALLAERDALQRQVETAEARAEESRRVANSYAQNLRDACEERDALVRMIDGAEETHHEENTAVRAELAALVRRWRATVGAQRKRAADAEAERDAVRARCREAAQTIIAAIGADGPQNVEEAAARVVARLEAAEDERDALRDLLATARAWAEGAPHAEDCGAREHEECDAGGCHVAADDAACAAALAACDCGVRAHREALSAAALTTAARDLGAATARAIRAEADAARAWRLKREAADERDTLREALRFLCRADVRCDFCGATATKRDPAEAWWCDSCAPLDAVDHEHAATLRPLLPARGER